MDDNNNDDKKQNHAVVLTVKNPTNLDPVTITFLRNAIVKHLRELQGTIQGYLRNPGITKEQALTVQAWLQLAVRVLNVGSRIDDNHTMIIEAGTKPGSERCWKCALVRIGPSQYARAWYQDKMGSRNMARPHRIPLCDVLSTYFHAWIYHAARTRAMKWRRKKLTDGLQKRFFKRAVFTTRYQSSNQDDIKRTAEMLENACWLTPRQTRELFELEQHAKAQHGLIQVIEQGGQRPKSDAEQYGVLVRITTNKLRSINETFCHLRNVGKPQHVRDIAFLFRHTGSISDKYYNPWRHLSDARKAVCAILDPDTEFCSHLGDDGDRGEDLVGEDGDKKEDHGGGDDKHALAKMRTVNLAHGEHFRKFRTWAWSLDAPPFVTEDTSSDHKYDRMHRYIYLNG